MLISHNWLKTYYKNPDILPHPEKIADLFTMHAFEIESLEEKEGDYIYDIKITADRSSYAYGLRYVALELALITPELIIDENIRFDLNDDDINKINSNIKVNKNLISENAQKSCSVYSLTKIENINNTESPDWIKQRLISIGQNPKSLLVDLTNFVMFDVGQPLHVFDADKIDGQIRVDLSHEGESVTILGGREIKLDAGTLIIRDDKDILAIAGVKGGIKAEVDNNTKNVYLESANFDQAIVRKTARKLNLINDSSKRFEQGLNKERFLIAIQDYIHLLTFDKTEIKVNNIEISTEISNIYDKNNRKIIDVNINNLISIIDRDNDRLETDIKNFIENILIKTGCDIQKKDDDNYIIMAPYHRLDLNIEADVADEFLRNKSYEILNYDISFKDKFNKIYNTEDNINKTIYKIKKFFKDKDFDEVILHTLIDSKLNKNAIQLENSLTSERDSLRDSLKNNLIIAIENNFKNLDLISKNTIKMFEIGNVFSESNNDIIENTHLIFALAMIKWPKNIKMEDEMNNILNELGMENVKTEIVNNIILCEINIKDFDFSKLKDEKIENLQSDNALIKTKKYKRASNYPAMSRDIAFFVSEDLNKTEEDIENIIKTEGENNSLIENYFRFDIFKKEDKTSYAYRFVFQSYEKTLTEEETKEVINKIGEKLIGLGFEMR